MALDPSIILQAGRGVVPLESPLDAMGKAVAVKQAMQQNQMQAMQLEDAKALRSDIAAAQGDPEALKAALLKRGKVKEVHEMGTAALQEQKAQREAQKAQLEAVNSLNGQQLQVYQSALDALDKDPTQAPAIHSFVLNKTLQNAKTLFPQLDTSRTDDPQGFQDVAQQKAWLQNKISQSMTMEQRLKQAELTLKERELGNFGGFHPAIGPDNKPGIFQANKTGEVRQVPGLRPIPSTMSMVMPGGGPNPKIAQAAAEQGPSAALEQVPADVRDLVKAVGTYRMMSTQLSPRQKNQIMGYVAQVFPNYNLADAEANHKFIKSLAADAPGSAGGTIAASERLLGHIGELADLTDKLGNSSFGKLGNIISGAIDTTTGTGKAGEIKSFELAKGKVIAELNKLANGGVPHAEEMVQDVKQLQYTDPPAVKYKVLQTAAGLGLEQTRAKEAQRDNILGEFSPKTSFLSPKAQGVVQRVWKNAGAGQPELLPPTSGSGYTTTARIKATPAPANVPPKIGSVDDGYVFLGGDPGNPKNWKKKK